jgi:hypothetical protein
LGTSAGPYIVEKRTNLWSLPGIEQSFLGCVAHSVVTMLTTPSQHCHYVSSFNCVTWNDKDDSDEWERIWKEAIVTILNTHTHTHTQYPIYATQKADVCVRARACLCVSLSLSFETTIQEPLLDTVTDSSNICQLTASVMLVTRCTVIFHKQNGCSFFQSLNVLLLFDLVCVLYYGCFSFVCV